MANILFIFFWSFFTNAYKFVNAVDSWAEDWKNVKKDLTPNSVVSYESCYYDLALQCKPGNKNNAKSKTTYFVSLFSEDQSLNITCISKKFKRNCVAPVRHFEYTFYSSRRKCETSCAFVEISRHNDEEEWKSRQPPQPKSLSFPKNYNEMKMLCTEYNSSAQFMLDLDVKPGYVSMGLIGRDCSKQAYVKKDATKFHDSCFLSRECSRVRRTLSKIECEKFCFPSISEFNEAKSKWEAALATNSSLTRTCIPYGSDIVKAQCQENARTVEGFYYTDDDGYSPTCTFFKFNSTCKDPPTGRSEAQCKSECLPAAKHLTRFLIDMRRTEVSERRFKESIEYNQKNCPLEKRLGAPCKTAEGCCGYKPYGLSKTELEARCRAPDERKNDLEMNKGVCEYVKKGEKKDPHKDVDTCRPVGWRCEWSTDCCQYGGSSMSCMWTQYPAHDVDLTVNGWGLECLNYYTARTGGIYQ